MLESNLLFLRVKKIPCNDERIVHMFDDWQNQHDEHERSQANRDRRFDDEYELRSCCLPFSNHLV